MKSDLNFTVKKDNAFISMHDLGVWVESFHIYSPNTIRNKIYIPGVPGAHLGETTEGERKVYISMQIEADNMVDYDNLKNRIYNLFYSKEPFTVIRDLFPNEEIHVVQEGDYDINNITEIDGQFELLLTMLDPYKYDQERTLNIPESAIIENKGTAEAKPIFELEVKEPVTYAMVTNGNEYNMIGQVPSVEEEPFVRQEMIFDRIGNTTTGWTPATIVDGGVVAGSIYTDGQGFRAATYGPNTSLWHGPSLQTSLPELLDDFMLQTFVTVKPQTISQFGRAELYLLNASGEKIAKLAMKNIGTHSGSNVGEVILRSGGINEVMVSTPGIRPRLWNDFYGVLRLERVSNTYKSYIAIRDTSNNTYHTAWHAEFEDEEGLFADQLAGVQIHLGRYSDRSFIPDMAIHRITVYKINRQSEGVPIILKQGDTVTFDHVDNNILVNGESIFGYENVIKKDFGGDYFKLKPGFNSLVTLPEGAFKTRIKYRERYR